ncbi:MAG: mechanosensitive ion channel family protein [Chloroflexota bacterium]|nr:MAG: mechanosensitive ion channel family protein [Chloroflexota bacterium]
MHQVLFNIVIPFVIFSATLLAWYFLRKLLFNRLILWSKQTKRRFTEIIINSAKGPLFIWFLMLAIYLALKFSEPPQSLVDITGKVLLVLGIISIMLVLSGTSVALIHFQAKRAKTITPVTSLMQNMTRIVIFVLGILIILYSLNIQITPILATLGVGGLAVALALQGTLSDLFAGFYISATRQIRIGDYIKLDSGEEGYVTDISWRATTIRMLPNNMILVPNEKLSKVIFTNYYLPQKELAVLLNLGVHYGSDLRKVEQVTIEVAKEVMAEVSGGVPGFEPFIRYHTFGDFSINFTVVLRAKEFVDGYLVKHEFIKRLHERYKAEGIVIPFPIRAVNYEHEQAGREIK